MYKVEVKVETVRNVAVEAPTIDEAEVLGAQEAMALVGGVESTVLSVELEDPEQRLKELAIMLGERTGFDISPSEVLGFDISPSEVLEDNKFIYYRNPEYPEEVEVYEKPLSVFAEPWDHLPLADSPFGGAS
jgi:hypothetical protein